MLLLKARKAKHPINFEYTQPSGRKVVRRLGKDGKVRIVPVKKNKKSNKKPRRTQSGAPNPPKKQHGKYGYEEKEKVLSIPLSHIEVAEGGQIRKKFNPKSIQTLADSIEVRGLGQPIILRPHPTKKNRFEIVAGERRFRAHKLLHAAGKTAQGDAPGTIRAVVRDYKDDSGKDAMQMVENIMREDNTPMEIAEAIKKAYDKGESFEDIARARGQRIDYIKNHYLLTQLHPDIQKMIESKEIPKKAGFILAELPEGEQRAMAGRFVREGWSIRTLDNHVFNWKHQQRLFEAGSEKTDEMKAAEEALARAGKSAHEVAELMKVFLNKHISIINKLFDNEQGKLTALGMLAAGTFDQNMKLFEMIIEKMNNVFAQMKSAHYELNAPSMFAKSHNFLGINDNTFEQFKRDYIILKSIMKYRRK